MVCLALRENPGLAYVVRKVNWEFLAMTEFPGFPVRKERRVSLVHPVLTAQPDLLASRAIKVDPVSPALTDFRVMMVHRA